MDKKKVVSLKKFSVSDREFLNKKLQTCPKYANVKSRTNCGFNTNRREEIDREIRKYYKVKNNEVFRRLSLGELLQLMVFYAEECNIIKLDATEGSNCEDERATPLKFKDNVNVLVHKMDEFQVPSSMKKICPYLLLDVRPATEFNRLHIATSLSYPNERLTRTVGWECQEMVVYRNHPDLIIVLYDENENVSPSVAETLIHRGYENTFILSGGLKLARDKLGPPLLTPDVSRMLSLEVAEFLCEKLSHMLLPLLGLDEATNWWEVKVLSSGNSTSIDSGYEQNGEQLASAKGKPNVRKKAESDEKKPWK